MVVAEGNGVEARRRLGSESGLERGLADHRHHAAAGSAAAAAAAAAAAGDPSRLCVGSRVRVAQGPSGQRIESGRLVGDDGPRHRLRYLVEAAAVGGRVQRLCAAEDLEVLEAPPLGALAVGDAVRVLGGAQGGAAGRVARVAQAGPVAAEQRYLVEAAAVGGAAGGGSAWAWHAAGELQLVAGVAPGAGAGAGAGAAGL